MKKPLILIIMDGFGLNPDAYGNAIKAAHVPHIRRLFAENPFTSIGASGMDVGLPDGQMGNSEVGHTNIGAGRVVYQELTRITKSIQDGDFFRNPALNAAMENARAAGPGPPTWPACSPTKGSSHSTHLYGLLEMAKRMGGWSRFSSTA